MPSDTPQSQAERVRVAVWGLGAHAERRLLPALAHCSATTIAGVTTRDAGRGARVAAVHGCAFWRAPEEMLRSDAVDIVLVATPIGCHVAHGRAVLEAGKHLWCEKSLTSSAEDAEALIVEARRRALVLAECFMFAYHPQFRRLRADAVPLGTLTSVTSRFFMPVLDHPGFRHSRALGGGGLLDVGCYPLHAALFLLGDDPEVLHARLVQPPGSEVDMTGHAVLASRSGATALLEWGFGSAYRNDLTVCSARGSIEADRIFSKISEYAPSLVIRDGRGVARVESVAPADSFIEMFNVLAGAAIDNTLREQLYRSAGMQARLIERVRVAAVRA
jgi:dTDP-3,4-didehydro-2,6-dideoxy-alpha-D-glucose 3-reductase